MQPTGRWYVLVLAVSLILSSGAQAGDDSAKAALDDFERAMKSDGERDRITALSRIATVPGKEVAKAIRRVVTKDRSERVQAAAAMALARRGDSKDLKFLLGIIRSLRKKPVALAGVVDAIGEYRDRRSVEKVADVGRSWLRKHKYPTLAAIRTLGKVPARNSVSELIRIYELTVARPGYGPARAAAKEGVDTTPTASGNVSGDTVARLSDFRPYIIASLTRLTGENIGYDIECWKDWWEDNEATFDFEKIADNPNRQLTLSDTEFRYSISRPDEKWQWVEEPEEGFSRTAEIRQGTTVVGRLSILTYSVWTRSPSNTEAMAEAAKKKLLDEVRELGDQETWSEKVELDGVPALRHTLSGKRRGGKMTLTQTMVAHRDVMYVIRLTLLPGIDRSAAKVAEDVLLQAMNDELARSLEKQRPGNVRQDSIRDHEHSSGLLRET